MAFSFGSRGSRGQDAATVGLYLDNQQFLAELNQSDRAWTESMAGMTREALKLELAEKRLANSLSIYGRDSAQAKRALVNLSEAQEQMRRTAVAATDATTKQKRTIVDSIKWFGLYSLGVGAIYKAGQAFTSTLQKAGDFQRSMNVLGVVTDATAKQMEQARQKAVALGRDITLPATSAADAADAMTTLAKAGLDMKDAISGSEGVLRLAAAAQISVSDASNIAAKSIDAFGLQANQAAHVADIFANAANASVGEIPDFALALSQSAQVAKSWNLSIEETVATLATFAQAGIQGSDAGTSFRVMLTRLTGITPTAQKALDKLGVSAFDSTGKIKPYHDILEQLHDAFAKLSPQQEKYNLQLIFGQDAQRAAGIAILNTIKNYDGMLAKIKETGTAQKYAAAINSGYVGSLDAFKSAVETLQISIGTKLLPTFTDGIKEATAWVNHLDDSGDAAEEVTHAVEDVTAAVHVFVVAMKAAGAVVGPVVDQFGGLERVARVAFGVWLVKQLGDIKFGIKGVGRSAAVAAAELDGMAAAERRASTGFRGAVGGGVPGGRVSGLAALAAAFGATAAGNHVGGPGGAALSTAGEAAIIGLLVGANPIVAAGAAAGVGGFEYGRAETRANKARWNALTYPQQLAVVQQLGPAAAARFLKTFGLTMKKAPVSAGLTTRPDEGSRGASIRGSRDAGRTTSTAATPPTGDGLSQLQRLQLATQQAALTASLADDKKAAQAEVAYYQKIAANTKLRGDALYKARQDLLGAQQTLQGIEDQIAQDRQQAADKAAAKRQAAAEKLAKTRKRDVDAVRKALETPRVAGPYANTSAGFAGGRPAGSNAFGRTGTAGAAANGGLTAAQLAAKEYEFLGNLRGVVNQYGSNFQDVNGRTLVELMRQNNDHLAHIGASARNPEARYGRRDAEHAMQGGW